MTPLNESISVSHKLQHTDTAQTIIWLAVIAPLALLSGALIGVAAFFIHHYAR